MGPHPPPTAVLLGGPIHAMADADGPPVEAVAVTGTRITAVGSTHEITELRDRATEVVDLDGQTLLPGLIEPHTHPDLCAQLSTWVDVSGFRHSTEAEVEAVLRRAVAGAEPDGWVFAFGLDPILTEGVGTWDRDRLDRLAPGNPVVVMIQSMHTLFVNSAALAAAGVDETTPDPAGGGRYQHDDSGRLTGRVVESPAMLPFLVHADSSPSALRSGLERQYDQYRKVGITTVGMPGLFAALDDLPVLQDVAARPNHPARTVAYLRHHQVDAVDIGPGDGDDRFRLRGVKLWYDGSPYSGTMLLDQPYLESSLCCNTLGIAAGSAGHANFEPDEMRSVLGDLRDGGWQVLTHVQGDRATREILDLYGSALGPRPDDDHRWRLEHCALISDQDLVKASAMGVSPSFHVNHVRYYGAALRDELLGPERAARLMPLRTAIDTGHRVSLHADSPMYPAGPLSLVATAVTRADRGGDRIAPHEAISVEEALRAVTIDAAWQLFADEDLGSIEAGKLADFTVLGADPAAVMPGDLDQIEVVGTWLDGRPTA